MFAQRIELELSAGPAIVALRDVDRDISNYKIKVAPLARIGLNYHINNHWSAGAHILYELKGSVLKGEIIFDRYNDPVLNLTNKYKSVNNLNYLSLPLMMQYTFGNKVKWFVNAGSYISYLMKAENHTTFYGYPDQKSNSNVRQYYKNIDAGISVGHWHGSSYY